MYIVRVLNDAYPSIMIFFQELQIWIYILREWIVLDDD